MRFAQYPRPTSTHTMHAQRERHISHLGTACSLFLLPCTPTQAARQTHSPPPPLRQITASAHDARLPPSNHEQQPRVVVLPLPTASSTFIRLRTCWSSAALVSRRLLHLLVFHHPLGLLLPRPPPRRGEQQQQQRGRRGLFCRLHGRVPRRYQCQDAFHLVYGPHLRPATTTAAATTFRLRLRRADDEQQFLQHQQHYDAPAFPGRLSPPSTGHAYS